MEKHQPAVSEDARRTKVSLTEDIIIFEILPKLSIKPLFRFKAVSKQYNIIISDPNYAYNYLQQWRYASGLETSLLHCYTKQNPKGKFAIQTEKPYKPISISYVTLPRNEIHEILGSSNGLILTYYSLIDIHGHYNNHMRYHVGLCVSNPLTKQLVELPDSSNFIINDWIFGIASKRDRSSFVYKIVLIAKPYLTRDIILGKITGKTITYIFSSDTGSWSRWNDLIYPPDIFPRNSASFSYNGILHWQCERRTDAIITYDPFNSPDRFGRIPLKESSSLIYSGEQEGLRFIDYGQIERCLFVEYDKGEWRQTNESGVITNMLHISRKPLVAPTTYNSNVLCPPFVITNKLMVLEGVLEEETTWRGTFVNIPIEIPKGFKGEGEYNYPLIFIEYCPWSSPNFYVAPC